MSSTVLALVQEFAALRGLPVPSALFGATDKDTSQLRAVVSGVVRECLACSWQEQKIRITWLSVATADQGNLETLFPGYDSLVQNSIWNMDRKIPVTGPMTDQGWAVENALELAGPPFKCWVSQNHLFLSPVPDAGETFSGIYFSSYGYAAGGVPQPTFTADSNTLLFPDHVVIKGIEYLWKKQKGEAYVDDYNDFMGIIAKNKTNAGMPALALDSPNNPGLRPSIYIPIGNWPV